MAATSQQSSQDLISDWFQRAAEMTEAAMMATARMQLATLDRFMESMTGARSMLESAPTEPLEWFPGFGGGPSAQQGERKAGAQQRGRGGERPSGQRKPSKGRSRSQSKSRSKGHGRR